jgi:hypothetical protein
MHKWVVLWLCVMVSGVCGQQLKLVSTQKLDMQPVGFRENKGQIVDSTISPIAAYCIYVIWGITNCSCGLMV